MKILLTPLGSHGDVHPFLGLGLELRRRGHEVIFFTNGAFRNMIETAGFEFVEVGTEELFREAVSHPHAWHPTKGPVLLFQFMMKAVPILFEAIGARYEAGDILAFPPIAFGARIAQEVHNIPAATIHIAPMSLRSIISPPVIPGAYLPSWSPHWYRRLMFWLGDKIAIDKHIAPTINGIRGEHGLPPVSRIIDKWWNSPQRIIGLFPDWFGPPQPDWPAQTRWTGFPLFDEAEQGKKPEEVETFLQNGSPPIIFTPGSANVQGRAFFQTAIETCQAMNQRGMLLTMHDEHVPPSLPPSVERFRFVPFSKVFPRAAAVVHHGGIGTTSQALRAGVPQMVMPMAYDQPDNAARLIRLGVADQLIPAKFTAENLIPKLRALLDPQVVERCREIAKRFDGQNAISDTCDLIEELPEQYASRCKTAS